MEQTDRSMTASESIPTEAASPVRLPPPLARDKKPRKSKRHRKDTDTYLKEKYPDSQL